MELNVFEQERVEAWRKRAGENLRLLREAIGVTQGEFASRTGVSRATLSAYELGARTPDLNFVNAVSLVTGCSTAYLLGQSTVMTEELVPLEKVLGVENAQARRLKDLYSYAYTPTSEVVGSEDFYKAMLQINDVHELMVSSEDDERKQFLIWQATKALERAVEKAVAVGIETWGALEEMGDYQQEQSPSVEKLPTEDETFDTDIFLKFRRNLLKQRG